MSVAPDGPIIEVEGLTKRFASTLALDEVSMVVHQGEVVGLLGPNGAGKTTLVRVLATLTRPDAGHIRVAGHDVVRGATTVRRVIGLAGQSAALDDLLTGRENLELIGCLYGLGVKERRRQAEEVLRRFDLADSADRLVRTYSGGMRRRLDLGATLVGRPRLLLLDEPTAGLDPRSRNELWRFVDEIAHEGTTVVLTSQYLEEVERLAGRIVMVDHGHIVAEGSPLELKNRTGTDVLEVRLVHEHDLEAASALVGDLGGPAKVDRDDRRISVPTTGGTQVLVSAGRRLGDAGIALADLGIRHPSLDDVFFALTGPTAALPAEPPSTPPQPWHRPSQTFPSPSFAPPVETDSAVRRRRSSLLDDSAAITKRYLLRFVRTPQLLFFGSVQPVLFVVGLNAIFGGLVGIRTGGHYIQYLLPGVVIMSVMLAAGVTAVGLAEDVQAGIIDRFRSLPMTNASLLIGRTVADLLRNLAAIALIIVAGFALGFRLHAGMTAGIAALLLAALFGYTMSWIFAAVGLAVKDITTAQFVSFAPVLPLVVLSGAWIPVDTMAGGLQAFARNQPVNAVIEAIRALVQGTPAYHWVWQALAWTVGLLVVSGTVAVHLYRRPAT